MASILMYLFRWHLMNKQLVMVSVHLQHFRYSLALGSTTDTALLSSTLLSSSGYYY